MSPRWAECHLDFERIQNPKFRFHLVDMWLLIGATWVAFGFARLVLCCFCFGQSLYPHRGSFHVLSRNKRTGAPIKKPSALDTFISNSGLMKSLRTCHLVKQSAMQTWGNRANTSQVQYLSKHPKTLTCLFFAVCVPCYPCFASKVLNDAVILLVLPRRCVGSANFTTIQ